MALNKIAKTSVKNRTLAMVAPEVNQVLTVPDESEHRTPDFYEKRATAFKTLRDYKGIVEKYVNWSGGINPFPSSVDYAARFLADIAPELAPSTLRKHAAAIGFVHKQLDYDDPCQSSRIKRLLQGHKNRKVREENFVEDQARALSIEEIQQLISVIPDTLAGARDRCILAFGFVGAFRESEVSAILVKDIQNFSNRNAFTIACGPTKNHPDATRKRFKVLPYSLGALDIKNTYERWLSYSNLKEGTLFRGINRWGQIHGKGIRHTGVQDLLSKWVQKAALENPEQISFHSMRASFVTWARSQGWTDAQIARQTHHKNLQSMQTYDRPSDAIRESLFFL